MGRRGRPPHPDILTPREWEVLGLLREGRSNPEIAKRLGISRAGAKYHVAEILSKLGLSSREEAARWRPEKHRPWWAVAFGPFSFLRRQATHGLPVRLSTLALTISVVSVLVLLSGLGLIAFLLLHYGEETAENAGTAGVSPEPAGLGPVPTTEDASLPLRPDQPALYVVNEDGTGLRKLLDQGDSIDFAISPHGRRVAVVSRQDEGSTLYVLNLEDGEREEVARVQGYLRPLGWSPDGNWLAIGVSVTPAGEAAGAYLYSAASDVLEPLAVDSAASLIWTSDSDTAFLYEEYPSETLYRVEISSLQAEEIARAASFRSFALSPDGRRLAVGCFQGDGASTDYSISVLETDGSRRRELVRLADEGMLYGGHGLSWSPDGDRLAYARLSGVHVLDLETGASTRLTEPADGVEQAITWSPDGARVLVIRLRCASCDVPGSKVVLAAADGSGESALVGTQEFGSGAAAWSPDGRRFAYSSDALYVADADGGDVDVLADIPGSGYSHVVWSQDGVQVFFLRSPSILTTIYAVQPDGSDLEVVAMGGGRVAPDGRTVLEADEEGLFLRSADGEIQRLEGGPFGELGPYDGPPLHGVIWSPDSRRLALRLGEKGERGLLLASVGGSARRVGTPGPVAELRWSRDGEKIGYWSGDSIWVLGAERGEPRRIADAPDWYGMDWSPDGSEVAYVEEGQVKAVRADGSGTARPVFATEMYLTYPRMVRWSPDGTRIAVASDSGLVIGSVDGGKVRQVVETERHQVGGEIVGVEWSQNGSELVFGGRSLDGDSRSSTGVYVVDADGGNRTRLSEAVYRGHEVIGRLADGRIVFISFLAP